MSANPDATSGDRLAALAGWGRAAAGDGPLRTALVCVGHPSDAVLALAADLDVTLMTAVGGREAGGAVADRAADDGHGAVIVAAHASPIAVAALVGLLTRANAAEVTAADPDDVAWMDACEQVREAMLAARPAMGDVPALLSCLGDEALATATGIVAGASRRGLGVLLDDAASCGAALAVAREERALARTWLAGARTGEPAQQRALDWLELAPVLDLGARLSGVGALTALGVVRCALVVDGVDGA